MMAHPAEQFKPKLTAEVKEVSNQGGRKGACHIEFEIKPDGPKGVAHITRDSSGLHLHNVANVLERYPILLEGLETMAEKAIDQAGKKEEKEYPHPHQDSWKDWKKGLYKRKN